MRTVPRDQQTVTYLEEFPVNLLHHVTNHTGHVTSSVLVIVQEYGKDFSGPGKDVFRLDVVLFMAVCVSVC